MRTPHLDAYITSKNRIRTIFKEAPLDKGNPLHLASLASMVANDLSPENLTCDGELRGNALRTKAHGLHMVANDLRGMGMVVEE